MRFRDARRARRPHAFSFASIASVASRHRATPAQIILTTRGFQEWDWLWKVNVGMFLVMFATPPWGWKKPHPYSDQRHLRSRGTQPGPW